MSLYFLGGMATFEQQVEGEANPVARQLPISLSVTTTHPLSSNDEYKATLDSLRDQLTNQNPQLGVCTVIQVQSLSRLD